LFKYSLSLFKYLLDVINSTEVLAILLSEVGLLRRTALLDHHDPRLTSVNEQLVCRVRLQLRVELRQLIGFEDDSNVCRACQAEHLRLIERRCLERLIEWCILDLLCCAAATIVVDVFEPLLVVGVPELSHPRNLSRVYLAYSLPS